MKHSIMRLEIDKDGMKIVPETPQDASFLKHNYGIDGIGDTIIGKHVSYFNFTAYGSYAIKFESIKEEK